MKLTALTTTLIPCFVLVPVESFNHLRTRRQQTFQKKLPDEKLSGSTSSSRILKLGSDFPSISPSLSLKAQPSASSVPSLTPSKPSPAMTAPRSSPFLHSVTPSSISTVTSIPVVPTMIFTTSPTIATRRPQMGMPSTTGGTNLQSIAPFMRTSPPTAFDSSLWPTVSPTHFVLTTSLPTPSSSSYYPTLPPSIAASEKSSSSPSSTKSIMPARSRSPLNRRPALKTKSPTSLRPFQTFFPETNTPTLITTSTNTSIVATTTSEVPSVAPSKVKNTKKPSFVKVDFPSSAPSTSPSVSSFTGPPSQVSGGSTTSYQPSSALSSFRRSEIPSSTPSASPSRSQRSDHPSRAPSITPSPNTAFVQSEMPSDRPSATPSLSPSLRKVVFAQSPSDVPSIAPSLNPSSLSMAQTAPSDGPSAAPSRAPSRTSTHGTLLPSASPSMIPTRSPSSRPSQLPSSAPTPKEKAYAADSVYSFPTLSVEMDETTKNIFEQVAQSFLFSHINMVPGIHVSISSFAVTRQSIAKATRRRLQSTGGLVVNYHVGAMVTPAYPSSFNFGYMVLNTFATYNAEFLQQLSEASTFFPSYQPPSYVAATSRANTVLISRKTTIYVTVSGVALCMAVFIILGIWMRKQRQGRRTLVAQDVPRARALGTTGSLISLESADPEAPVLDSPVSQYVNGQSVEMVAKSRKPEPSRGSTESLAPI